MLRPVGCDFLGEGHADVSKGFGMVLGDLDEKGLGGVFLDRILVVLGVSRRAIAFPGWQLVKRLEAEQKAQPIRENWKFLPGSGTTNTIETKWLRQFDDFYGFRGSNVNVFLLSPWEFVMYWEVLRLPPNGTLVSSKTPDPKPVPDRNKNFQVSYKTKA